MKFLSNVDLAYHWGLLKRELFIVLWIVIFGMLGLYLLGKIRLSHDSDQQHVGIGRLLFALLSLSFALYLVPGIWGAPLKLISGFPPPDFYKEWKTGKEGDCPHDILCFKDYEEGMRYAKEHNKPVMIDFTGWSCVNCRKMEDNVWSDPKVLKKLGEDYVLISLYVDDKTPLPTEQQSVPRPPGERSAPPETSGATCRLRSITPTVSLIMSSSTTRENPGGTAGLHTRHIRLPLFPGGRLVPLPAAEIDAGGELITGHRFFPLAVR